ncbi:MAG TPA: tetratricopeptide repeat protein [Steroidobacteraceae bacterium]|jgi:hypothetical protein
MRKSLILLTALAATSVALASPTPHDVYEAANSGHLAEAQQMMTQVLKEHPKSGAAHYTAAELYARTGDYGSARRELNTAETLEPGLPNADPAKVRALERQISQGQTRAPARVSGNGYGANGYAYAPAPRNSFPWGTVLIVVGVVALVGFIFRRRAQQQVVYGGPGAAGPGGYGTYGGGYGPGSGPMVGGGGIGSGIAGGLASGLAVGAGVVAGEELARHFLDSDGRRVEVPPQNSDQFVDPNVNSDMGGEDFGLKNGSSWDDNSSSGGDSFGGGDFGGGGGGDGWT